MKICILTGKFGMGHFSAATAIKQQIDDSGLETDVEIIDWLHYASPKLAKNYYKFYSFLVSRGSGFYNKWYRFYENKKTNQKPELSHYFNWCFSKFMEEKMPDLIISTLPMCSQTASLYKEKTNCTVPLITCVTDITSHSEWISKNTDFYLVGTQSVKDKFIQKGVSPEKIYGTGIPVRLDFISNSSDDNKGIYCSVKKLLIMGGGLGMLPENMEFYDGLDLLPNTEITIITGKNDKLFHLLYGKYENIKILGYVENICDYMKQTDLIITKPGGITTFEAIHAEVPIIALNPFLQQEIYNAQFIQEMHIGTIINGSSNQCLADIKNILSYGKLEVYRNNIRKIKGQLGKSSLQQVLRDVICSNHILKGGLTTTYINKNKDMMINEKISFNI